MAKQKFTPEQVASLLGCSVDQVKKQYAHNATQLSEMQKKAEATGKKVNGYTAQQLKELSDDFKQRSR